MTLAIVALVFVETLVLAKQVRGWTFYLTTSEVVFEVVLSLTVAALAGVALGTVCTAVLAPFLHYFKSSRQRIVEWATNVGVVLVVFLDSRYALATLLAWSYEIHSHRRIFDLALYTAHFLVFVVALLIPRARKEVLTSLDGFVGEKMTRRIVLTTLGSTAALVTAEFVLGKTGRTVRTALSPQRPKSNVLLISFDALSAEDMSVYGYGLPTTPNIDAFARKSTVFKHFYAASTFTTPAVATMLMGTYPSENHVHQLQAPVDPKDTVRSLPHLMRAGGYGTGALVSNPFAYYFAKSLENEFDFFPDPVFQKGGLQRLWDATSALHQDSGFGSRINEYREVARLWSEAIGTPNNLTMRFRAAASFEHAREVLAKLPEGFFLWIHVMTPHHPYLPDPVDWGRFLSYEEQKSFGDESETQWMPHYNPDQQSQVSRRRLLYDEFVLTADRAFGSFMADLENGGKLQNTAVIVSADHGESFEGGVYRHQSPYLTRSVIHVPLIIRTPGQQEGRLAGFTADQTALAPTVLDLAGQPKPTWMRGESLVPWLNRNNQGEGQGQAFSQYLEKNSRFRPLRHGMAGVFDGPSGYQYVLDLDTQKGALRPLGEAHIWNLDRTSDNPALAETLRATIYSRFPELVRESS